MKQEIMFRLRDENFYEFGEMKKKKLNGRGIFIHPSGTIRIAYRKHREFDAYGNYILIWSDGLFKVMESYLQDGKICYGNT